MVRKEKTSSTKQNASGEPVLTVTAQQSRFHADAETSSAIREIVIKDLSVSLGARELISNADIHLQPGRHYVLVGRNGVGKSTLLTAMASGSIPSIAKSTRILLLNQTEAVEASQSNEDSVREETVLQHVLRSDKERETLTKEAQALSQATENTADVDTIVRTYRRILHDRLGRDVAEARRIATRRSGARGLEARKEQIRLEDELLQSQSKLENLQIDEGASEQSEAFAVEIQQAFDLLVSIQSALESMNSSAAEAKARSVLLGLGFSIDSLDHPMSRLSGGWQTRCRLACALCQPADVLLLDEPTNYLDLPSIIWFEQYLQNVDPNMIIIVVTHDRSFADGVGDELLCLREQKLERFRGTLSAYELDRIKSYKYLSRMQEAQDRQKKHMQASIDNNLKAAKRTGDDKKLKQAASRQKKLDERMGMEVSAKGTRFKRSRDLAGYHLTNRAAIELPSFDPPAHLAFPTVPSDLRFPGALLSFENVTFSYSKGPKAVPVLREVNLTIHPKDRIGLVGLNGSGKSTLVSLAVAAIDGGSDASRLISGSITGHTRAKLGLYSQQSVEELNTIAAENSTLIALTYLQESAGTALNEQEARGLLSSLGLVGKTASDVPVSLLSGGQKVRLALARILWNPPHLLILDEVTTHLDSDTIQALALALKKYEGAILVITHDRFFMRCVVEGESPRSIAQQNEAERTGDEDGEESEDSDSDLNVAQPGVVYRLLEGKLIKLEGGMQEYERRAQKASAKLGAS